MFPIKNISMRVLHTFQMGTARCHSSAVKICWWVRWHCPLNTGFEIWALAVWGRARYLSVTKGSPKYWMFTSELVFKCSFCSFICGFYDVSLSKWPVIQYLIVFYVINPYPAEWNYLNFQPLLRLCLATAIHNLKWLKITHICLNLIKKNTNLDIYTIISFPTTVV